VLTIAIITIVNNTQSTIGAIIIVIIVTIKGLIPLNYSLGIKGFYIGFTNYI
jgi:hypothetical protein